MAGENRKATFKLLGGECGLVLAAARKQANDGQKLCQKCGISAPHLYHNLDYPW